MYRDPATGVIRWFVILMICVGIVSSIAAFLAGWAVWRLVQAVFGG